MAIACAAAFGGTGNLHGSRGSDLTSDSRSIWRGSNRRSALGASLRREQKEEEEGGGGEGEEEEEEEHSGCVSKGALYSNKVRYN